MDISRITPQHVIYIPSVLMLGLVVGFIWGSKSVRAELERRRKKLKN